MAHQYKLLFSEGSLSNTVDDSDDDLSGFLLGLATSCVALGGSWVLDFHGIAPACNPLLASISRLLRHAGENRGAILFTLKP